MLLMIKKCVVITILVMALSACDSDFRQGSCDDGFYEQNDPNGGYFCAPITETSGIAQPESIAVEEGI